VDKGAAKPLEPPHPGALPPRITTVGWAYVMSKKEVATSGMVVTTILFLNSNYVLFDSGATHSFIFTLSAIQLNLKGRRLETNIGSSYLMIL